MITLVRGFANYMRENPQALVLLIVCLVLGLGTFLVVLISIAGSGNGTVSGEPSGLVHLGQLASSLGPPAAGLGG